MDYKELHSVLRHMKLTTVPKHFEDLVKIATQECWSHEYYLFELLALEQQSR
jgi:hypothetical protein